MEKLKVFLTKRNIFILIGVLVAVELVWAGWTLSRPQKTIAPAKVISQKAGSPETIASLTTPRTNVKVGEKINVTINLTSSKATDGTDLIIIYNPGVLSIDPASVKNPVSPGKIYTDYPINTVDEKTGRITVSGITSQTGGTIPQGIFGTVTFITKTAGTAVISFDFVPGSTSDSNVVETKTAKDLLDKAENLEVSIR